MDSFRLQFKVKLNEFISSSYELLKNDLKTDEPE